MKFRERVHLSDKAKQVFRLFYFLILSILCMLMVAVIINNYFNGLLSNYRIVIQSLRVPFISIIIAPIDEEFLKFLGYVSIYIVGIGAITTLGYASKKEFRNDYFIIWFLVSAGGFGLLEGMNNNIDFSCSLYFLGFIALNALAHITYSIYPYMLGRKYNNMFILFLPIGMLLHSVHNFVIDNIWNNKWVTFAMVTSLLLPIIFMERKNLYKIVERLSFSKFEDPQKANFKLCLLFVLLYIYIFISVWLGFL